MAKQEIDPKDAKKIPTTPTEPVTATPPEKKGQPRVACPITTVDFLSHAKPLSVEIEGQKFSAMPKNFSTGSVGFHLNPKIVITINGVPVQCQVGLNVTVIGSKPKP